MTGLTPEELLARLERLTAIGVSLSAEKDTPRLLESILLAAKEITNADGGTLYRVEDGRMRFEIMRTDSLGIAMGGTTGAAIPFPPISLRGPDGQPNEHQVVAYAVNHDCTINIADAYEAEGFDFSGTRQFDKSTGYRSKSFLTVPMKNHESEIIGVLQLLNAREPASGEIVPFSTEDQRLAESLASQAAIALTNRLLIDQLEKLFESFIKLINIGDRRKIALHRRPLRARTGAHHDAGRRGGRRHGRAAGGFPHGRQGPLRTQDRRPAARLRQGHHAGPRGGQGHQAADHLRPHRR